MKRGIQIVVDKRCCEKCSERSLCGSGMFLGTFKGFTKVCFSLLPTPAQGECRRQPIHPRKDDPIPSGAARLKRERCLSCKDTYCLAKNAFNIVPHLAWAEVYPNGPTVNRHCVITQSTAFFIDAIDQAMSTKSLPLNTSRAFEIACFAWESM